MRIKHIGTEKALQKIKKYCDYQERSHKDVKKKLYSFGLYKQEVESLLSQMIVEGNLNEERFAISFARGKFRINKWGKVKIKYELKLKEVSEYCIKIALASIDETEYVLTLDKLCGNKLKIMDNEKFLIAKRSKLYAYLAQKGYERHLINGVLQHLKNIG